jgi:hypothetical protein
MAHDVLISYSSKDKQYADAMCATLENKGIRCWIAPRDILAGTTYARTIIDAINRTRILVLLFSSNSNRSQQVLREVERAVSKGIPIIPFRIEDAPLSEDMEYFISGSHWLDALSPPLETHFNRLAETVSTLLKLYSQQRNDTTAALLRLTVHIACFAGSLTPGCFINATNLCRDVDMATSSTTEEDHNDTFSTFDIVFHSGLFRPQPTRFAKTPGSRRRDTGHESAA